MSTAPAASPSARHGSLPSGTIRRQGARRVDHTIRRPRPRSTPRCPAGGSHDTTPAPSLDAEVPGGWITRYEARTPAPHHGVALLETACATRAAVRWSPEQPPDTLPLCTGAIGRAGLHSAELGGVLPQGLRGQATRAPRRRPQRKGHGAPARKRRPSRASRPARSVACVVRARAAVAGPPIIFLFTHLTQPLWPALSRQNGKAPIDFATWPEQTQLKKTRARRYWATARVFVQVYPYALFWHAYVGKQLCAPCGKWAEGDRAAFEEEFSELGR